MKLRGIAYFGCLLTCLAMGFVTHDAAAEALDVDSFKERVAQCVAKGRPQWSQEQRAGLATLIVPELRTKMGDRLDQTAASNILDHLEFAVNRIGIGASSDAAAVAVTQEYFRWAIADYASRSDMTAEQIAELEKQIRDCFGEVVNTLGKEITSDLHERLGQSAAKHLEGTLRSMHDPLFPGLKHPISTEQFGQLVKEWSDFRQHGRQMREKHGISDRLKGMPASDEFRAVTEVEAPLMQLRSTIESFGVTYSESFQQAMAGAAAQRQGDFEDKRACFMNLRSFGFALRLQIGRAHG